MFQMLLEARLKLTPVPQNQMLVCPQPTIRDLNNAQNKLSVHFFNHPPTIFKTTITSIHLITSIHPPTVIPKTAITSNHPSYSPLTHLRHKRAILFFIFLTFHPSTVILKTAITSIHPRQFRK